MSELPKQAYSSIALTFDRYCLLASFTSVLNLVINITYGRIDQHRTEVVTGLVFVCVLALFFAVLLLLRSRGSPAGLPIHRVNTSVQRLGTVFPKDTFTEASHQPRTVQGLENVLLLSSENSDTLTRPYSYRQPGPSHCYRKVQYPFSSSGDTPRFHDTKP